VVLITAPDSEQAARLARCLVEQRLAACVNRVPGVKSIYWWKGALEEAQEELLIAKTHKTKVKELIKRVKKEHPSSIPEVLALKIKEGNRAYLKWMDESIGKDRVPIKTKKKKPSKEVL
jgi:periplasmic divalent cation tolerance protein